MRLTRLCAVGLIILSALPFTAPFATLDAADFFGTGRGHTAAASVDHGATSAQDDNADDAAASDALVQRVHPAARCGPAAIPTPLTTRFVTPADRLVALGSVPIPPDTSSALAPALRL